MAMPPWWTLGFSSELDDEPVVQVKTIVLSPNSGKVRESSKVYLLYG